MENNATDFYSRNTDIHDHEYYHNSWLVWIYCSINPFTAKDAIWRPHGITHLRICLSARYNFYYAFQQQCANSEKVTPLWGRLLG